jgi:hypothetical protein
MPKKRNHQFKPIIDQSQRPTSSKDSSGSTRTVNERLAQLRAEQAPRPTIEQRNEIASLATSHTLPPHLRRILAVPETAPPLPKAGARRMMRVNGRRLPPGPAAPQSWLAASLHAPAHVKARAKQAAREVARMRHRPEHFSRMTVIDENHSLPKCGSLLDLTLKAMAAEWEFIAEYEQLNLATLPIRWKTVLLSYLSVYGPEEGVTVRSLRTLFLTDDVLPDATGGEDLARLDFTGLITESFTILDLEKFLHRRVKPTVDLIPTFDGLSLQPSPPPIPAENGVVESWEDEASAMASLPTSGFKMKRFPNLTRLSLANAGPYTSWSQLLSLTSHLSMLTHLSLANWPVPTTTPNSKTAFITHNHASIPVSGSHFYNRLDDDWAEAASILKRLSKNTYRLQWLDLEGCADWTPALTWCSSDDRGPRDRWIDRTFGRSSSTTTSEGLFDHAISSDIRNGPGPDWNGSWAQLTYANISQGIIPRDVSAVRAYPAGIVAAELLLWLRDDEHTKDEAVERSKGIDVQQWLQQEKEARVVERTVRALRTSVGGVFCEFDHGWTRPMGSAAAVFKGAKGEG